MGTIEVSDLERIREIKRGNGGAIYEVNHRPTNQHYALKVILKNKDDKVQEHLVSEIERLRGTNHPNIVKIHNVFHQDSEIQVLLEYMDGGSLEGRNISDESMLSNLSSQILSSLVYLHSHEIVHFDLKPSNILVKSLNEVKLAYFGATKIASVTQRVDVCNSFLKTISYTSPDKIDNTLFVGDKYDWYAGNIWSFGLIILEVYLGSYPIVVDQSDSNASMAKLMSAIVDSPPLKAPSTAPPLFQHFIECCLQKNPASRWKASALLRHPFITLADP